MAASQITYESIRATIQSLKSGMVEVINTGSKTKGHSKILVIADDSVMDRNTLRDELAKHRDFTQFGKPEISLLPGSGFEGLIVIDKNAAPDGFALLFKNRSGRSAKPPTEFQEGIVCYAMAMRQEKGSDLAVDGSDIKQNYKKVNQHVEVFGPSNTKSSMNELSLNECIQALDDTWFKSASVIANAWARDTLVNGGYSNWTFHRASDIVGKIYKNFTHAKVEIEKMQPDKWNPADIWAVRGVSIREIPEPSRLEGIQTMNEWLKEYFDKKKLVGISLKKTTKEQSTFTVINNKKEDATDIDYVGPTDSVKKIQNSITFKFKKGTEQGAMQFRSFESSVKRNSYQGNITGFKGASKDALHGKVGIWRDFFAPAGLAAPRLAGYEGFFDTLRTQSDIANVNAKWAEERKGGLKQDWSTCFLTLYNDVNKTSMTFEELQTKWDEAIKKAGKDGSYNFASNLFGLQLAKLFEGSPSWRKRYWELIVLYAMSKYPGISSIHIKNS